MISPYVAKTRSSATYSSHMSNSATYQPASIAHRLRRYRARRRAPRWGTLAARNGYARARRPRAATQDHVSPASGLTPPPTLEGKRKPSEHKSDYRRALRESRHDPSGLSTIIATYVRSAANRFHTRRKLLAYNVHSFSEHDSPTFAALLALQLLQLFAENNRQP